MQKRLDSSVIRENQDGISGSTNYQMKIRVEFTLPEDDLEYENFLHGAHYRAIVHDIHSYLRKMTKYGNGDKPASKDVEEAYQYLCETMSSYCVEL